MKWFKHDSDASIDSKLQELLLDYGATGYGLYWYCVELIAQGVSENNITFELDHDARIIARNLNLSVQETKDMMKYMIELGLFSITNNEKLACYALAKRLDQSMTSNKNMRNIIKNFKENHDEVMTISEESHDKVMQEEKRREEKRRDKNKSSFDIFIDDLNKSFEENKISTFKSKINKTKSTKEAFKKYDELRPGVDLIPYFVEYVKRNRNMSARLDKFLIAFGEGNLSDIEYAKDDNKSNEPEPGSAAYYEKMNENLIDGEVVE